MRISFIAASSLAAGVTAQIPLSSILGAISSAVVGNPGSALSSLTVVGAISSALPGNAITSAAGAISSAVVGNPGSALSSLTGSLANVPISSIVAPAGFTSTASPSASFSSQATTTNVAGPARNPGLSGGAIAGVVVGVLAILILVALVFFLRRRKRRGQAASSTSPTTDHAGDNLPEVVSSEQRAGGHAGFISSAPKELPATTTTALPAELASPHALGHHSTTTSQVDKYVHSSSQHTAPMSELSSSPSTHRHDMPQAGHPVVPPAYSVGSDAPEPVHIEQDNSQVAKLEAEKAVLDEKIARMRYLTQMEQEQSQIEAELARLRSAR